jgi:hypothetical protein
MATLGLFFVGAVLFVNGVSLLGAMTPKATATLNVLVGTCLVVITGWEVFPLRDFSTEASLNVVLGATGFALFGFTYIWLGIIGYSGIPGAGLGWYCAWAAVVAAFLAIASYTRLDDPKFGMLWILWTVLFVLFFAVLALGQVQFVSATGWIVIMSSFVTATIPGGLMLVGEWGDLPSGAMTVAGLASLAVSATLLLRGRVASMPAAEPEVALAGEAGASPRA